MRLAWATDIHLNFADTPKRQAFWESLKDQADAVVISGDIAESRDVAPYLQEMESRLQRPIFFVLGNHDFYRGSIAETRTVVTSLAAQSPHLSYLSAEGVIELTPNTGMVGHDGWADARLGNFMKPPVMLNDYMFIRELTTWRTDCVAPKKTLGAALKKLGDEAATHLEKTLSQAAASYANVILVTHVPPFREACWHEGQISDDDWLPHFSCKATGEAMCRVMQSHPACNLLVLCGHTHGGGETRPRNNIHVLTGEAEYGKPEIRQVFELA